MKTQLITLISTITILAGCTEMTITEPSEKIKVNSPLTEIEFIIGTVDENKNITPKAEFNTTENIGFKVISNEALGSNIDIYYIKVEESESIMQIYNEVIDPSWGEVQYEFINFGEVGEFKLRVYGANEVLLGEGNFTVK